jgi:hypothetical protein
MIDRAIRTGLSSEDHLLPNYQQLHARFDIYMVT